MHAPDASTWFAGDLGDPWVARIADALPRRTLRIDCPAELPELWPTGQGPRTLVLHRANLTTTDLERLRNLRSRGDFPPRVVLCAGAYARYHQWERWGPMVDAIVPEATASETIARHLIDAEPRRGPRDLARPWPSSAATAICSRPWPTPAESRDSRPSPSTAGTTHRPVSSRWRSSRCWPTAGRTTLRGRADPADRRPPGIRRSPIRRRGKTPRCRGLPGPPMRPGRPHLRPRPPDFRQVRACPHGTPSPRRALASGFGRGRSARACLESDEVPRKSCSQPPQVAIQSCELEMSHASVVSRLRGRPHSTP